MIYSLLLPLHNALVFKELDEETALNGTVAEALVRNGIVEASRDVGARHVGLVLTRERPIPVGQERLTVAETSIPILRMRRIR